MLSNQSKNALRLLLLLSLLSTTGCGTLVSLLAEDMEPPPRQNHGGVKLDIYEMTQTGRYPILNIVNVIDLPLSVVGDTAALPPTLWINR